MNITQLNQNHSIPDTLNFIEGPGKQPLIAINNGSAKAIISLYGGQVLSFQRYDDDNDLLFLSNKAIYDESKAIRGGIPLCWPWFGADPDNLGRPNHGFARASVWSVKQTEVIDACNTKITLQLIANAETKALCTNDFELIFEITIGESLTLALLTRNTGTEIFTLSQALHTYFQIGDIKQLSISGLQASPYLDKLDNFQQKQQQDTLTIAQAVDRIYTEVNTPLLINDTSFNRQIKIETQGSHTAVIWNPWAQDCAKITDLETDDYQRFICVEASNTASDSVQLGPGEEHCLLSCYQII